MAFREQRQRRCQHNTTKSRTDGQIDRTLEALRIPGAPHTLINLTRVRHATAGFVADVLRP